MDCKTIGGDSYPVLEVTLGPGEEIVAESGAMAWMDSTIRTKTAARGGILAGLSRSLLTGESFFQNTYTVEGGKGTVALVAGSPGTLISHEMTGDLYLEKGAYLASTPGVQINAKWDGLKGLFNEGLFVMRAQGEGTLFFSGYGDVREVAVDGEYVVDNGYVVAWEPALTYTLSRGKKLRSFLFGDQILLRFKGKGRLWVQSRSPQALANFFHPFRPVPKQN
jgi:uncharacterized protein (TIGR00266 family)